MARVEADRRGDSVAFDTGMLHIDCKQAAHGRLAVMACQAVRKSPVKYMRDLCGGLFARVGVLKHNADPAGRRCGSRCDDD